MAKVIQISSDGGSNYNNLPGSEGGFNSEAESVDDTILGQTYGSTDVAMIGWQVASNALWKGFSGYLAEIKQQDVSTAMTAEAMTLESGKTYFITDDAKSIWDRSEATFDILDNAVSVADADIESVDYLFGRVTFVPAYVPTTPITVTGNFFTTKALAQANTYNLAMTAETIDESTFNTAQANGGYRIFTPGLRSVSLELGGIFDDTGAFADALALRNEFIIEVDAAGDGSSIARGFFKLVTTGQSGAVGALEDETLNFNLTVPDETTNPDIEFPFNWRHTATTMNVSIQDLLTSWLTELNTYDVQYLPQGAIGQTPLDGKEGKFMVADISLTGGLSNMNTFAASLQGTDAFTTV